jgi:hypothetical protein
MVLTKEYRICMPLTVEEVKFLGFMYSKLHSWMKIFIFTNSNQHCLL